MTLPGNKRKPAYGFWVLLLIIALYFGYCLGTLGNDKITIETAGEQVKVALLHPFPFRFTDKTLQIIMISGAVWLVAFLSYVTSIRNYMSGKEFGAARFSYPKEINKRLADKNPKDNKILSEHLRLSIKTQKTRLNNNVFIIGGSGAGKSMFMVTPNTHQHLGSYVFTDPKGELLRDNAEALKRAGYEIKVINLIDDGMDTSDCYNPFVYVKTDTDVVKLITNLIANTTPKGSMKGDPFWEKAEGMYLQSLFFYVWLECPQDKKNFRSLLELLNKAKIPEDEDEMSELDELMYALPEDHPALLTYNKVRRGATDTVRSIIISANSRLAYMQNPKILNILDKDDMDLSFLGRGRFHDKKTKTALFCIIPDSDKSYNFIIGMLYTQIFQELYYHADFRCGGKLPIQVMFWFDEFANIALPEDFCSLLSTMRSRGISANIIIQNLAQIKAMFKDTWETIPGNCDTMVYLGGNEQSTHEYISKSLGKWTIDKKTTGESLGRNGNSSRNFDILGRELMTSDEVRKLNNHECIVFIKGQDPVKDLKYRTFEKKEFKDAQKLGRYKHPLRKSDQGGDQMDDLYSVTIYNEAETEYFKEQAQDNENISILPMSDNELVLLAETEVEREIELTPEQIEQFIEENKEALLASAKDDEKCREEIAELERPDQKQESLSYRLTHYEYTPEQIAQVNIGIKNGLSEELILNYFLPSNSAELMHTLRLLAEQSLHN